jgi:hypothetical protein
MRNGDSDSMISIGLLEKLTTLLAEASWPSWIGLPPQGASW